ncbi:MAG: pyruvate formate lyase-activating protein [Ruminococcaceae bacterium]|nr:pyruvate formate lyase-activating protein [Oscillospiraceae bacterium]
MNGFIHSFESLAAVDGAGIRCAVFMAGCPLRCAYCHNPDTWDITKAPIQMTPYDFVKKVSRYKPYYKKDGGVTFSGGEPLLQAEFIKECVSHLKEAGIGYVIDTSGYIPLDDTVKYVLKGADAVLLDLKFWDDESYLKYTGKSMENTLKTLDFLESINKPTVIRTVVIPEINDTREMIEKYLTHVRDKKCVRKYELLAFHTMGFFKYRELGIENRFADKAALDKSTKEELQHFVDSLL